MGSPRFLLHFNAGGCNVSSTAVGSHGHDVAQGIGSPEDAAQAQVRRM